jgi:DNA-binding NarL/FixJ family response regulator
LVNFRRYASSRSQLRDGQDTCAARSVPAPHGYVLKHAPGEEIVRAVKAVIAGGRYVSPEIAHLLPGDAHVSVAQHSPFEGLSTREHDVLRRVVSGSTSAEIAKCLSLSPKTVETYRARFDLRDRCLRLDQ